MLPNQTEFVRLYRKQSPILNAIILDREDVLHALYVAFLSNNNVFLLGGAGVAKTMIFEFFARFIDGVYFGPQLHAFTKIDEWDGPQSIAKFKEGEMYRNVANFAPGAHVLCADEIGRADAIHSCMYRLTNEHTYMQNGKTEKANARLIGACSNSPLPANQDALDDRFAFKFKVNRPSPEIMLDILCRPKTDLVVAQEDKITIPLLDACREEMKGVEVPLDIKKKLVDIYETLETPNNILLSPRLMTWALPILQAVAYIEGRMIVEEEDVWVLRNVFARNEKQTPAVAKVMRKICNQELDMLLDTYDQACDFFKKWEANACPMKMSRVNLRTKKEEDVDTAELFSEMVDVIKGIKPKSCNKVDHGRMLLDAMAKQKVISSSAIAKRRDGTAK